MLSNKGKAFRKFSTNIQLFVLAVCVILIIVFLLFVFYPSEKLIKAKNINNYENTLAERSNLMSTHIEHANAFSLLFYDDYEVYDASTKLAGDELSSYEKLNAEYILIGFTSEVLHSDKCLTRVSIKICDSASEAIRGGNVYERKYDSDVFSQDNIELLKKRNGGLVYFRIPEPDAADKLKTENISGLRMLRVGRVLKNYMNFDVIGAVMLDMDVSDCFAGISGWEHGEGMLMTTREGEVICGEVPFDDARLKDICETSETVVSIDGTEYSNRNNKIPG